MSRYERNILIDKLGALGQQKLKSARVLVCGAGGLGSSVIMNLAALGVGHIGIIDNDRVELSNLNRQFVHKISTLGANKTDSALQWVKDFNPEVEVMPYNLHLDENNACALFTNYDVIADCFDNFSSKFALCKAASNSSKLLVHAGVEEFFGQVSVIAPNSACLACFMPELYSIRDDAKPKKGIVSPVVSIIGSIQAMEILKILTNIAPSLKNELLTYSALDETFRKIHLSKNPLCPLCAK